MQGPDSERLSYAESMAYSGRAVVIRKGALSIEARQFDAPTGSDVLVRVAAAGLNRADLLQVKGYYPAPPGSSPDIPGLEYSGIVEAVGSDVRTFAVGERVMGIVGGGAMATHIRVHEREVLRVPAPIDSIDAAAIPEAHLTVWDALMVQARISAGKTLLIHAATSGIGTAAIQLARVVGAIAVGTGRNPEKLARCSELGLEHSIVIDGEARFADAFRQRAGRGADIVLDTVGAAYLDENLRALSERGIIVGLGLLGGAKGELTLATLLAKRAQLVGSVLRSRPLEEKAALAQDFARHALPLFERGSLKAVVERRLPMEDIESAHRAMESNRTFGKTVLYWASPNG